MVYSCVYGCPVYGFICFPDSESDEIEVKFGSAIKCFILRDSQREHLLRTANYLQVSLWLLAAVALTNAAFSPSPPLTGSCHSL